MTPDPFSREALIRAINAAELEGFWLWAGALLELYRKLYPNTK